MAMNRKWVGFLVVLGALTLAKSGFSEDEDVAAAKKAVAYLSSLQNEDGTFGKSKVDNVPGIVGLAVQAIATSPEKPRENNSPILAKAAKYLVSRQLPSGAITAPSLGAENYHTSVAVTALAALENPAYKDVLDKGRQYILTCQMGDDAGPEKAGGFAYSTENKKADNSNTCFSLEALKAAGLEENSPAWKNAIKFIKRGQDNAETNDLPGVMKEGDNTGGFVYAPGVSTGSGGTVVSKRTGKTVPKPYGNMTYQAIKGLIYAKIDKTDPALQAAYKWVKENYSVTKQPGGNGTEGYYYYLISFTKAFAAMGEKEFVLADGRKAVWAKEMAAQIRSLQKPDGSFVNDSSEYLENDPVLATSEALLALNICIEAMK